MNLIKSGGKSTDLLSLLDKVVTVAGHEHLVSGRSIRYKGEWKHHARLIAAEAPGPHFSGIVIINRETGKKTAMPYREVLGDVADAFAGWRVVKEQEAADFIAL